MAPKCACFDRLVAYHLYHQTGERGGTRTHARRTCCAPSILTTTFCRCSNQLSYPIIKWWEWGELNSPLPRLKVACHTTWLHSHRREFLQNSKLRTRDSTLRVECFNIYVRIFEREFATSALRPSAGALLCLLVKRLPQATYLLMKSVVVYAQSMLTLLVESGGIEPQSLHAPAFCKCLRNHLSVYLGRHPDASVTSHVREGVSLT